jgi:hypothetical protein
MCFFLVLLIPSYIITKISPVKELFRLTIIMFPIIKKAILILDCTQNFRQIYNYFDNNELDIVSGSFLKFSFILSLL